MLYLDNSATTQIHPDVKNKMLPFIFEEYGNPSSKYYNQALSAKSAVEEAREQTAALINSKSNEVIFTSGSTESNNLIIKGVSHYYKNKGNHIITTDVEHPSVLECFNFLETEGFEVTYLKSDKFGRITKEILQKHLRPDTILVSIMWGNNELGSLNPIKDLSELCMKQNIFFHSDATQVIGKIDIDLNIYKGISFLSFSAHKFHGPKGVGVAYIRSDDYGVLIPLTPLFHGGGQENNYRSGTLAIHNIVGLGEASKIAKQNFSENITRICSNEKYLVELLLSKFKSNISFNNDSENKIPGVISVQFKGVNNEILLKKLAPYVAASTGSACSSSKPSYVLNAAGLSLEEIRSTIRFSLSSYTLKQELEIFNSL